MTDQACDPGADLPQLRERLRPLREIFLANLILTSEIPAPTFGEEARARFVLQRFSEAGLPGGSLDEAGNAAVELPGANPDRRILVVAHTDTLHTAAEDHAVAVQPDRLVGPGIGDNAAGVAAMMTLPRLLATLGIRLDATLVLLGAGRSLGPGDLGGLKFFLDHAKHPFAAGLCLEGLELGRLNFASLGLLRGEIVCRVPRDYDWARFGPVNAIVILADALARIQGIPLPARPRTDMVFGQVSGGTGYGRAARTARLRLDVRSESAATLAEVEGRIGAIAEELAHGTRTEIAFVPVARRQPGALPFDHPFVREARAILAGLGLEPHIEPSMSELSAFLERDIPALTIGLTRGENVGEADETVFIEPLFDGLAQLLSLLQALDRSGRPADED